MESKREKFMRMYAVRFPKALKAVELLGNLASTRDYEPSSNSVEHMITALESELNIVRIRFGLPSQETVSFEAPKGDDDNLSQTEVYNLAWAYDRLRAGDSEMGMDLIAKILKARS